MNDDARAILAEPERDCRARGDCPLCGGDCPMFLPCDDCADCGACGGGHHIQHCPDVGALLFAPEGTNVRGLAACLAASRAR